ncbi:MAG: hypothetical protein WA708_02165 [Acidobacteriaceae bacterium]
MHGNILSILCFLSFSKVLAVIEKHVHRLLLGSSVLTGSLAAGFLIYWVIFHFVLRKTVSPTHHRTLRRFRKPAFWLLVLFAAMAAVPTFGLSRQAEGIAEHILHIVFIACLGWFFICGVYAAQDILLQRYDVSVADNLRARRMRTQMAVMRRLVIGFIALLALGLILYTFNGTRLWQAGAGLLASAGAWLPWRLPPPPNPPYRTCLRESRLRSRSQSAWTMW